MLHSDLIATYQGVKLIHELIAIVQYELEGLLPNIYPR